MITITPTPIYKWEIMLGEKMGSMTAKSVNKVLPTEWTLPKFEVTAEGTGTLAGVQVQMMSTYHAEMRADGSIYGELPNSGLVMTSDGVATWWAWMARPLYMSGMLMLVVAPLGIFGIGPKSLRTDFQTTYRLRSTDIG